MVLAVRIKLASQSGEMLVAPALEGVAIGVGGGEVMAVDIKEAGG
jgi:hypothetical protein